MSHVEIECPFCQRSHSFTWEGKPCTVGTIKCACHAKFTFTIRCELGVADDLTSILQSEGDNDRCNEPNRI